MASAIVTAWPAAAQPVSRELQREMAITAPSDRLPVVVVLQEYPDVRTLLDEVRGMNRARRREYVVTRMRALADRSQVEVRKLLDESAHVGEVGNVRVLWGINGLALEATPAVIDRLADLPGILEIVLDRAEAHADGDESAGPSNPEVNVASEVVALGAKRVWDELGYTGFGVTVAVIDTGFDRTHPDIADHIWSNPGELPANGLDDDGNGRVDDTWGWDFCANSQPVVGQHGTQVAGQVAGDGTLGTITGMAPDAQLMSLGIDCDTPSRAWEASDYAIAEGADVLTQSYSWWWTDRPNYAGFRRQTDVELAAGLVHVNSAGNFGANQATHPIPYNISTPGNAPAPWIHPDQPIVGGISSMIAVGDISRSLDVIASSSSIGPSAWEEIRVHTDPTFPYENPPEYRDYPYHNGAFAGLIKPDLSAYGSGTTSICPGEVYCGFSGTSSAAPHVSGTIALMLQSNLEATPEEIARALMTTAQHRGTPGKNNVYGAGMVQAFPAVQAVESEVYYTSHAVDDTVSGNGDGMLDPGETVILSITIASRSDAAIDGIVGILASPTPGITVHDRYATYPTLPARGTAASDAPHFSVTIDPSACTTVLLFDLELRFDGIVRRSTFQVRVGEDQPVILLEDGFESDLGWSTDRGVATQGFWVREDPIGVLDASGRLANPADDTSPTGASCWVTGNGELTGKKDENNNDVDGGGVTLLSPPFGRQHMLSLTLAYDRWYYDVDSANQFRAEVSNDGGANWTVLEQLIFEDGGWVSKSYDLFDLLPPTDDMRLRFQAIDDGADDPIEAAVDEVRVQGVWVDCQPYTPPTRKRPNPVGATLRASRDGDHVALTWSAPPVDANHDAASLYRIERATAPTGPWSAAGSATSTRWIDVDAALATQSGYYRVTAENSGGTE